MPKSPRLDFLLVETSALVITRQLEFHIIFVQLVNVSLSYYKLEFL